MLQVCCCWKSSRICDVDSLSLIKKICCSASLTAGTGAGRLTLQVLRLELGRTCDIASLAAVTGAGRVTLQFLWLELEQDA